MAILDLLSFEGLVSQCKSSLIAWSDKYQVHQLDGDQVSWLALYSGALMHITFAGLKQNNLRE